MYARQFTSLPGRQAAGHTGSHIHPPYGQGHSYDRSLSSHPAHPSSRPSLALRTRAHERASLRPCLPSEKRGDGSELYQASRQSTSERQTEEMHTHNNTHVDRSTREVCSQGGREACAGGRRGVHTEKGAGGRRGREGRECA